MIGSKVYKDSGISSSAVLSRSSVQLCIKNHPQRKRQADALGTLYHKEGSAALGGPVGDLWKYSLCLECFCGPYTR